MSDGVSTDPENLRDGDARYRTLFNSMDQGFAVLEVLFGPDGKAVDFRYVEINPAFEKQTGLRPVTGKLASELLPDLEAHWFETYGRVASTGEPVRFEHKVNELGRWFEVHAFRIGAPDSKKIAVLFTDVTQRKQMEAALRESERQFRTLADSIPQLAWMARPNGDVFWFNQRWLDYTGTTLDQMLNHGWHNVHHPDWLEAVAAKFEAAFVSEELWEDTFPLRRHDGAFRWHLSRMLPVRDDQHRIVLWFGTNTDITEQRGMAENLRQNAADLLQANRRKNEFLATLAHELRNPLAPLRNALEILRLRPDDPDLVRSNVAMMERQFGHLVHLVDDLLDISRIGQGKIELRKERIELASAVHQSVEAIRPLCEARGHALTVNLPSQAIWLDADPTRLAQVLGNLLNNACKYSDAGGRIVLNVEQERDQVLIKVRDSGIGISAEQQALIFEMFAQVDTSLDRAAGGMGIGLALARKMVELHAGSLEAHSGGIGQGSEFVVRLPIGAETPTRAPPPASARANVKPRRVLVVDDNLDSAESMALLLSSSGHETHMAHDGQEAVHAVSTFRPEVVLLDIGLPKMDGYEAAKRIRELPSGKSIVLVALTGWGQEGDRKKARDAGFDHHMIKPVDYAALLSVLAERR